MDEKTLDKWAREMTLEAIKKNKDIPYREGFIFTKCILRKISEMVSDWVEEFVKKEILKIKGETKND